MNGLWPQQVLKVVGEAFIEQVEGKPDDRVVIANDFFYEERCRVVLNAVAAGFVQWGLGVDVVVNFAIGERGEGDRRRVDESHLPVGGIVVEGNPRVHLMRRVA